MEGGYKDTDNKEIKVEDDTSLYPDTIETIDLDNDCCCQHDFTALYPEGNEEFNLKLGEGVVEFETIFCKDDDGNYYIEIYRSFSIDDISYDGFDQSMKLHIDHCPFCGRAL